MNINFGMDNFYVRYLKRFLNSEFQQTNTILGEFNRDDQKFLIQYLNTPNVETMAVVQKEISIRFPRLKELFIRKVYDDRIVWTSTKISMEASTYIREIVDELRIYCKSVGWNLVDANEWVDELMDINNDGVVDQLDRQVLYDLIYNNNYDLYTPEVIKKADINLDGIVDIDDLKLFDKYLASGKLTIEIKKDNRKNFFPNKDMLVFVNQFDGTFLYDYALRDGIGITDKPHPNPTGMYKVAIYPCKPNQKVTIAHNNTKNTRLVIGSATSKLKQDITGEILQKVEEVYLNPGDHYEYQASGSDTGSYSANWICIQCPSSYGNLSGTSKQTITLELGDVNFDGKVDMEDYKLIAYYTATGANAEQYHWEATPKQKAAMDIYKDGKIDTRCAQAVWDYIHGTWGGVNLGLNEFTCDVASDYGDMDNVSNLLIIDGWYDKEVGIPFLEFAQGDGWIIHEKFFNYLLNMAVTKYSNSESITFVQEMLKNYYSHTFFGTDFLKVGIYNEPMRELLKEYQNEHVEYTFGDLDLDGKLTEKDLVIMREYIYSFSDEDARTPITLADLRNYLDNGITLTTLQQKWADVNRDGIINEEDYQLLRIYKGDKELATKVEQYLKKEYSLTPDEFKLADMNKDNIVDEEDLKKLQSYPRVLNGRQLEHAYIKHDKVIDTECYDILESNVNGTSDNLRIYQIPFALGWYDVQTEYYMESEYNMEELISEVSK